ncbi:MAG: HlyD family efflux transporter periplasmic adaptor subunit [Pseudanabaena sp.]
MIKHKFRRQLLSNNLLDKSLSKGLVAVIGALLVSCSANAPKGNGFGAGATTKQKLDEVANNLRNARAELGQIDAQMNAQQASINSAATRIEETRAGAVQEEVQLDFYTVAAPFAGIVGDIPIKVGDNVNSTTQLTTVTQNQVLEVQISVPVENAPRLKMGMHLA